MNVVEIAFPQIVALTTLAGLAAGQTGGTGGSISCNDLTRTLQQPAGVSGTVVTTQCATLSVSVAGVTFSTPTQCNVAWTQYCASVYSCGPAATGIHCNARGYKATIKNYRDGACPTTDGLTSGDSWRSWEEVPAALVEIIQGLSTCVPPMKDETFDWSASTVNCPSTPLVADESPLMDRIQVPNRRLVEDPRDVLPEKLLNPFQTEYQKAMKGGGGTSDPLLLEVESNFEPVNGVHLDTHLTIRHFRRGETAPSHEERYRYEGSIDVEGNFLFEETSTAIKDGKAFALHHRRGYAEGILVYSAEGAPVHQAYAKSHQESTSVWTSELLPHLSTLYHWLDNPFRISRFASHEYRSERRGNSIVLGKLERPGFIGKNITIERDGSLPRVTSTEVLDGAGRVRSSTRFGEFRRVGPGILRPFAIEHTLYLDAAEEGRRVVLSFEITSARMLTDKEVDDLPRRIFEPVEERPWEVWF